MMRWSTHADFQIMRLKRWRAVKKELRFVDDLLSPTSDLLPSPFSRSPATHRDPFSPQGVRRVARAISLKGPNRLDTSEKSAIQLFRFGP